MIKDRKLLIPLFLLVFLIQLLAGSPGLAAHSPPDAPSSDQFLTLPFPPDPEMQVQQGWKYTWDGNIATHKAVDYIKGTINITSTWQSFDILAPADGRACWDSNFEDKWGNYIRIGHRVGDTVYETYYGHLKSRESFINLKCDRRSTVGILEQGIPVYRGAKIGVAGTSGTKEGIHLHFQLTSGGLPGGTKVDTYDIEKECDDYPDPNGTNGKKSGPNHYWTTNPPTYSKLDARLVTQPGVLVLKPGESRVIQFDVQNTGNITWVRQKFFLENINGETLGALSTYILENDIQPNQVIYWEVPITAPEEFGNYNTEWQMTHNGEPFGPVMSCSVIVVAIPEGNIDIDLITLLKEWFNDLIKRFLAEINEFWENLKREIEEWFQRELERLWREFWENLFRQLCGTSALAPAVLLFGAWGINRRWRRRTQYDDGDE